MKKIFTLAACCLFAVASYAQLNYKVQTACHPDDVKHYDTERLRSSFLMEKVMSPDEINLTYTLYDRLIYGGAMPVNKVLVLETFDDLEAEHFLDRRELGVINVGGPGVVTVDGKEYPMIFKEGLYVGCGKKEVTFKSVDPANPAKFYINSTPAYKEYVTQLITTDKKVGLYPLCNAGIIGHRIGVALDRLTGEVRKGEILLFLQSGIVCPVFGQLFRQQQVQRFYRLLFHCPTQ